MSDLGKQHTPNGAELFAAYFFHALDWSLATTDPYLIAQISAPSCSACTRYINQLNSLERSSGKVSGGRIAILTLGPSAGSLVRADQVVAVTYSQTPSQIFSSPGATATDIEPAEQGDSRVYVSWVVDQWMVEEIGTLS